MQSRPTVDSKDNARQIAPEGATWETGGLPVPTAMRSRNPRAQCVSERKSRDEYGYHCRESDGVHHL